VSPEATLPVDLTLSGAEPIEARAAGRRRDAATHAVAQPSQRAHSGVSFARRAGRREHGLRRKELAFCRLAFAGGGEGGSGRRPCPGGEHGVPGPVKATDGIAGGHHRRLGLAAGQHDPGPGAAHRRDLLRERGGLGAPPRPHGRVLGSIEIAEGEVGLGEDRPPMSTHQIQ
jgi:hypothetical protein